MDHREIEMQLRRLPVGDSVVFAARAALRVLPLLAHKQSVDAQLTAFYYWPPHKRSAHLLALLMACMVSMREVLGEKKSGTLITSSGITLNAGRAADAAGAAVIAEAITADAAATNTAAILDTPDIVRNIAAAAAHAAYAATDAVLTLLSSAADTRAVAVNAAAAFNFAGNCAADEIGYKHDVTAEMVNDLRLLNTSTAPFIPLIQQPLWAKAPSNEWQQLFTQFAKDALSLNAGFEYWLDWFQTRIIGGPIELALLEQASNIPEAIQVQGAKYVNAYLMSLRNQSAVTPLNRVRAFFIGYGDAGKTSVIRVLHNEPVKEAESMTPGIEFREWPVPNTEIKALFWDFGGQVMVHATHQLFLRESCLYVLVISARNEINATEQAEYWLEHVKAFGKSAPVIIVGNKADLNPLNLDMATLREKYPNIVDFFPIACTQAHGKFKLQFDLFRQEFCQQLQAIGTHQIFFTSAQFKVLTSLRQLPANKTLLSQAEYVALCNEHGVEEAGLQNRAWLLDILDKLGVIIHFPQLPFADGFVINPRWLTYGVYKIMYAARPHLSAKDIVAILGSEKVINEVGQSLTYPPDKCFFIIEAMKEFKLCYSLPGQPDTLIIPALLAPDAPRFKFDKLAALAVSFEFMGFLPRHVLPEVIVNRHVEILQNGAQSFVWQHGVCLESKRLHARAVLQVDYHLRTLSIWIIGPAARDYLMLLRDEIQQILARITIIYKEWLILPHAALIDTSKTTQTTAEKAPYMQLLTAARRGATEFIAESGSVYDVAKVLEYFIPAETINPLAAQPPTIRIKLASSYELSTDLADLDMYLRLQNDYYRKQGIILEIIRMSNPPDDMKGSAKQHNYSNALQDCDIFLNLLPSKAGSYVSANFSVSEEKSSISPKCYLFSFFKDTTITISIGGTAQGDLRALWAFQDKLKELGYYFTFYENVPHLQQQFSDQLNRLVREGELVKGDIKFYH